MATQIKLRRDTYQNWYDNNPVLGLAEPGFDTTNKKLKIGDGATTWRLLPYFDDKETVLSAVTQDIVPNADNMYDIGSPSKRWRHGYFATGSLYVGDIKISNNSGQLVVQQVTNVGTVDEAEVPDTPGVVTTDRIINGANTFAITAAGELELNGDPFTGSGGSGDRLTNGSNEVVLDSAGLLTFPNDTISTPNSLSIQTPSGIPTSISTWNGQGGWNQGSYNNLATSGGTGSGLTVNVAAGGGGYINISAISISNPGSGYTDGDVITINNENNLPGTFVVGITTTSAWNFVNGALAYPNEVVQQGTNTVSCSGNATTVVYTASSRYRHTIKLLIQVEGSSPGQPFDTQSCEMIIAKSYRADDIAASVYGVVHTSVAPLATFTAQWNATSYRVEVLCTTPGTNSVNVRIFATEITSSD